MKAVGGRVGRRSYYIIQNPLRSGFVRCFTIYLSLVRINIVSKQTTFAHTIKCRVEECEYKECISIHLRSRHIPRTRTSNTRETLVLYFISSATARGPRDWTGGGWWSCVGAATAGGCARRRRRSRTGAKVTGSRDLDTALEHRRQWPHIALIGGGWSGTGCARAHRGTEPQLTVISHASSPTKQTKF